MPTGNDRGNDVLDAIYGDGHAAALPATLHVALYHVAPTDAGGGTEASYTDYERFAIANTTANFPAAVDRRKEIAVDLLYAAPDVDTDRFVAWAIHGHVTDDDVVNWGTFRDRLPGEAGRDIKVPAGLLFIELV